MKIIELRTPALGLSLLLLMCGCLDQQDKVNEQRTPMATGSDAPQPSGEAVDTPRPKINATTYYAAGQVHEREGNLRAAAEQYFRAIAADRKYTMAYNRLGIVYDRMEQHDKAVAAFTQALELSPDSAFLMNNLAYSYMLRGEYEKAEPLLRKAIQTNSTYRRAWVNLGVTLTRLDHCDEAADAFAHALPQESAHLNVGLLLVADMKYDKARHAFEQSLKVNPTSQAARTQIERLDALCKDPTSGPAVELAAAAERIGRTVGPSRNSAAPSIVSAPPERVAAATPRTEPTIVTQSTESRPAPRADAPLTLTAQDAPPTAEPTAMAAPTPSPTPIETTAATPEREPVTETQPPAAVTTVLTVPASDTTATAVVQTRSEPIAPQPATPRTTESVVTTPVVQTAVAGVRASPGVTITTGEPQTGTVTTPTTREPTIAAPESTIVAPEPVIAGTPTAQLETPRATTPVALDAMPAQRPDVLIVTPTDVRSEAISAATPDPAMPVAPTAAIHQAEAASALPEPVAVIADASTKRGATDPGGVLMLVPVDVTPRTSDARTIPATDAMTDRTAPKPPRTTPAPATTRSARPGAPFIPSPAHSDRTTSEVLVLIPQDPREKDADCTADREAGDEDADTLTVAAQSTDDPESVEK